MTRYRKKPIEVEAIVYAGDNVADVRQFIAQLPQGAPSGVSRTWDVTHLWIEKAQAWGRIEVGDVVIRESDGSGYFPCAKAVFEATYESVEELNPLNAYDRLRDVWVRLGDDPVEEA